MVSKVHLLLMATSFICLFLLLLLIYFMYLVYLVVLINLFIGMVAFFYP